jgi:hypothetical protein
MYYTKMYLFACLYVAYPIFKEEPHLSNDPVDVVADFTEGEGKSHRPS